MSLYAYAMHYAQLNQWGPILAAPGVQFVNLQYDECGEELREAERSFGGRIHLWNDLNLKNDQEAVAALFERSSYKKMASERSQWQLKPKR